MKAKRNMAFLVTACTLLLMYGALLNRVHSNPPIFVDEPGWVTSGYLTWKLLVGLSGPAEWIAVDSQYNLGAWGNMQPPAAKALIGMAVALSRDPGDPLQYVWVKAPEVGSESHKDGMPPWRVMRPVRAAMAGLATLLLLLSYLIALEVTQGSRWFSLIAPLLLFLNRRFQDLATQVMTDIPQAVFTLAAIWLMMRWLHRRATLTLAGAAICVGLACASKFSAGSLALAVAACAFLVPASLRERVFRVGMIGAVSVGVFLAINPYLWPAPIQRTLDAMRDWGGVYDSMSQSPEWASAVVTNPVSAVWLVVKRSAILVPLKSEVGVPRLWMSLIMSGLTIGGAVSLCLVGLRLYSLPVNRGTIILLIVAGMAVGGVALYVEGGQHLSGLLLIGGLLRIAHHTLRARRMDQASFMGLIVTVTACATVAWLPFDWPRYYMPLLVLLPVVAAYGAMELQVVWDGLSRRGAPADKELSDASRREETAMS